MPSDDPLRLLLTCEALADTDDSAFLLTVEDISAKSWIDGMGSSGQVLLSGILNDRFIIEQYFKYYPSPVVDRLFRVEEASLNEFFQEKERERISHRLGSRRFIAAPTPSSSTPSVLPTPCSWSCKSRTALSSTGTAA